MIIDASTSREEIEARKDREGLPDFTPVPRGTKRHDGWTPKRQYDFIAALGQLGSVTLAARTVGLSHTTAYALRYAPGAAEFNAAWDAALDKGVARVYDVLVDHAVHGTPDPIMFNGEQVGERRRHDYRMMMWLLKHHRPDRFPGGGGLGGHAKPRSIDDEQEQARLDQAKTDDNLAVIHDRISLIRRNFKKNIAHDPDKRAAWELLVGPTDWVDLDNIDPGHSSCTANMHRPDMIVTLAGDHDESSFFWP